MGSDQRARQDGTMRIVTLAAALAAVALAGCDDDTGGAGADMAMTCSGGPVTGAPDDHCSDDGGTHLVTVDKAQCTVDAGDEGGGGNDYGETQLGSSGYDDDCKYSVSFTVDGICESTDTFFTVTLKNAADGTPVTGGTANGAQFRPEVFLDTTHPANTSKATTTETSPGVYKVGPIQFDKKGRWTVRFHFFEECTDSETSPHGHAAFFLDVP
jgi:hypothetical protein